MRVIFAALAVLLLLTGCLAAAPGPSYFPLVSGATWMRKADDGGQITARVVGTETVGSVRCTVVETKTVREGQERVSKTCYQATDKGISVIETVVGARTTVLDPPRPLMLLPPAVGKSWMWSPKNSPADIKVTDQWVAQESVKVAAGTFRAWKLKSVTQREDATLTTFTWYAPGVGIVKIVREVRGGGQERGGGSELVSYKIP